MTTEGISVNTLLKIMTGMTLFALAVPAFAYPNGLTVGQEGTSLSGTIALSSSGTIASGIYQYDDANGNPAALDPAQNSFAALLAYGNSSVTVSGGSLYALDTRDNSTATVSGGTINGIGAEGFSTINITGVPQQTLGAAFSLGTTGSGTIDLFGSGFTVTPTSDTNLFTVRGTLLDGNSFIGNYSNSGGRLLFNGQPNPVPEASSFLSLGLLLTLGLSSAFALRRKQICKHIHAQPECSRE